MVKNRSRNIAIGVVLLVAIGVVTLMIVPVQPSLTAGELNVTLPPLGQLTDAGFIPISLPIGENVVEVGEINCKVKQTTLVHGVDGRLLEEIQSGGIQGSPFIRLAFVTGTDTEVASYNVVPKVFCSVENNIPIEVFVKEMQLNVRCENPSGGECSTQNNIPNNRIVWSQGVTGSSLLNFGSGQGEQSLVNFYVPMNQVESNFLPNDFTMFMNFEITGTLAVQYSGFTFEYIIPIYRADLETFDQIDIKRFTPDVDIDTDGDKIFDQFDQCPNDPETYNGIEDADGCPDNLICPEGSLLVANSATGVQSCTMVDPDPPTTCESSDSKNCSKSECDASGGTFHDDASGTYCTPSDTIDLPLPPPVDVEDVVTTEEFLSGMIRMVGTVVYKDLSQDTFVVQEGIFFSSIGQLDPLTVTTVIQGAERDIERIEVDVYYIYPNTADALATTLEDSDLNFRPAIRISGTEQRLGSTFVGTAGDVGETGSQQIPFGTGTGIGNGFLLSSKGFLARDIQAIGTSVDPITADPLISEGNSAIVTLQVDVNGDFSLSRESTTADFSVNDAFVLFSDITINNLKGLLKDSQCLGGQVPIRDVDGQQTGCVDPTEGDRDADGVSDIADQCPDEFGIASNRGCPAPDAPIPTDTDGDGIPDTIDPDIDNDGIPNDTDLDDDGDGIPDTEEKPPCDQFTVIGTEVICVKGTIVFGGNNGEVCSIAEPQNCPTPAVPFDLNTLLVIGGVGFIIIGVTVAVLRRR
jgi:hypothetical protein